LGSGKDRRREGMTDMMITLLGDMIHKMVEDNKANQTGDV
jgi:hypothetical protein